MVSCWQPHGFPKEKSQELLSARVAKRAEDSLRNLEGGVGGWRGRFKDDKVTFSKRFERKEGGRIPGESL